MKKKIGVLLLSIRKIILLEYIHKIDLIFENLSKPQGNEIF